MHFCSLLPPVPLNNKDALNTPIDVSLPLAQLLLVESLSSIPLFLPLALQQFNSYYNQKQAHAEEHVKIILGIRCNLGGAA